MNDGLKAKIEAQIEEDTHFKIDRLHSLMMKKLCIFISYLLARLSPIFLTF